MYQNEIIKQENNYTALLIFTLEDSDPNLGFYLHLPGHSLSFNKKDYLRISSPCVPGSHLQNLGPPDLLNFVP